MGNKKMRKRTKNRLILLFGCILAVFILFGIVKTVSSLFTSEDKQSETTSTTEGVDILKENGMNQEDIDTITSLSNYRPENAKRYATYTKVKNLKKRVLQVNCDMDLEPYSQTTLIKDDSDMTLLVNKFYALPEGYAPSDLVTVEEYACVQGEDYSCQTVDQIELRKEVYDAYLQFCQAAKKENINIRAIAGYRSYDYQKGLWDYYADTNGEEYADTYYARPGQSEHNSGLSIDITFNGHNFNEIEKYDGYDWILKNMHKYGFILRYPEDKVDVTRYGYESWHIRYVGKKAATTIYKNNWTLEEYHGSKK